MTERVHVYTVFVPAVLEEGFLDYLDESDIDKRYEHTETRELR